MGVYYDIYTEVLFNGNWINIDSRILGLDNKLHHAPVIVSIHTLYRIKKREK